MLVIVLRVFACLLLACGGVICAGILAQSLLRLIWAIPRRHWGQAIVSLLFLLLTIGAVGYAAICWQLVGRATGISLVSELFAWLAGFLSMVLVCMLAGAVLLVQHLWRSSQPWRKQHHSHA